MDILIGIILGGGFFFNAAITIFSISYILFSWWLILFLNSNRFDSDKKILYSILILFIPFGAFIYYFSINEEQRKPILNWLVKNRTILIRTYLALGVLIFIISVIIGIFASSFETPSY